jgi:hypothetical protein
VHLNSSGSIDDDISLILGSVGKNSRSSRLARPHKYCTCRIEQCANLMTAISYSNRDCLMRSDSQTSPN